MGLKYAKLRGKIRECYGTQEAFSAAMAMHPSSISNKLNGATDWTRAEMEQAAKLLHFTLDEIHEYFFTQ